MSALALNKSLSEKWLEKHGLTSTVPPLASQLPAIPINRHALRPFGYNPSICRWLNRTFLAYRHHENSRTHSHLYMAELDGLFNVISDSEIAIVGNSIEDPRIFVYKNELWISFVDAKIAQTMDKSLAIVRYGKLQEGKPWRLTEEYQPKHGKNEWNGIEKNWVFFEHEKSLLAIYQSQPSQIILSVNKEDCSQGSVESKSPFWPYGPIKGGTAPMPYKGKLLRFFHSSLDNEQGQWPRRYYVGAMVMSPKPPFEVLTISSQPVFRGSEIGDLTPIEQSSCLHFKGNVVFPGGAISDGGNGWLLAAGINDCSVGLFKVKESDLNL